MESTAQHANDTELVKKCGIYTMHAAMHGIHSSIVQDICESYKKDLRFVEFTRVYEAVVGVYDGKTPIKDWFFTTVQRIRAYLEQQQKK